MKILAIDTTRKAPLVLLISDEKSFKIRGVPDAKAHCGAVLPLINNILNQNKVELNDIDYFSAIVGPGSFTGIRIGVATVNAFSAALKKPLIKVNSLEIMYDGIGDAVCLIDALHGNCYGEEFINGKSVGARFYEKDELNSISVRKIYQNEDNDYAEGLECVLRERVANSVFSDKLLPLYLRESQAEREAKISV